MATVFYPAIVERAGAGFSVFFPDLPGCTSAGDTLQEAALNADGVDANSINRALTAVLVLHPIGPCLNCKSAIAC